MNCFFLDTAKFFAIINANNGKYKEEEKEKVVFYI